jgi:hypothetical protein
MTERQLLFDFCFEQGCMLIPNMHYNDNSYLLLKNTEEYIKYAERCPLVSVVKHNYQVYPLEMDFFERESKKIYYVKQRFGGPFIDFYSPVLSETEKNKVGPGFMSIYSFYHHYNQQFIPSPPLSETYDTLKAYIKRICVGAKIGKTKYWIGRNTIAQFRNREIDFVDMEGFNWNEFIKSM